MKILIVILLSLLILSLIYLLIRGIYEFIKVERLYNKMIKEHEDYMKSLERRGE